MRKILLYGTALLAPFIFSLTLKAQIFTYSDYTALTIVQKNTSLVEIPITIKNNTDIPREVLVKRVEKNIAECHETYFCWALCYSPAVSESPQEDFIFIPENDTSKNFKAYIIVSDCVGEGSLTYAFYDKNNPSDSIHIKFNYRVDSTEVGISNKSKQNFTFGPNPARNFININTATGIEEIVLFDLSGRMVVRMPVSKLNTKHTVSTEHLNQGIYLIKTKNSKGYSKPEKFYVVK